jgi:transposase
MRSGGLWHHIWRYAARILPTDRIQGASLYRKTVNQWQMMPQDLPPWSVVYQQTQRWIPAGYFEILVEDLRSLLM